MVDVDAGQVEDAGGAGRLVACRCEDVPVAEVDRVVGETGARSLDEIRKLTRAGMGACQGRTCAPLLRSRLALAGVGAAQAGFLRARPPLRPVALASLAAWGATLEEPVGTVNADVLWGRSAGGGTVELDEPDDTARAAGPTPRATGAGAPS